MGKKNSIVTALQQDQDANFSQQFTQLSKYRVEHSSVISLAFGAMGSELYFIIGLRKRERYIGSIHFD